MTNHTLNCDYSTVFDIAKTADEVLSSTSLMLDRIIKNLNKGKLKSVEREISNLESVQKSLAHNTTQMRSVIEGIPKELAEIQNNRNFRASDVLTLGTTFAGRQFTSSLREWGVTRKKEKAISAIETNRRKAQEVQDKINTTSQQLRKLESMDNPSWWSRFILSIKAFFSTFAGFVSIAFGDFVSGAISIASAARSVARI